MKILALAAASLVIVSAAPAHAQDDDSPRRTRVILGPQLSPDYPGSSSVTLSPYISVARARGDDPFAFEAPDESFNLKLVSANGFSAGGSLGFEGKRSRKDTDGALPKVGFGVELGGYAQYQLIPAVRVRAEARQAVSGHDGFVANLSADYIARDGDNWVFSIGPRVTLTDGRYQRAYFGIAPADAAAAGLPAYRPDGGLQAAGATTALMYQFTPRIGALGFVKYDRLVEDAGDSPVVRRFGSRNQVSGGIALSYTFGAVRD
ncbi:MipA/OmpV family protein [Sphingomonas sp. SUN019]|uniref:MipA/OmpV family protein n=1 Tax=Sphingomonas sp. SUN019 TaxID=2937788 RepID=UPI002164E079|nr:MipA/OmpV family protein [Sphingomonas sp. SUN019]UVO50353.1 MipA/OmpV family protein [Sphingomonas sp. SUN019]